MWRLRLRAVSTLPHRAPSKADPIFQVFGGGYVGGLNVAIIWVIALVLFFHVLLFYTAYGNHLLAVGGDAESARARGVRVVRTKWITFVICSTLAALAGILEAAKIGGSQMAALAGFGSYMPIAAAVTGGCVADRWPWLDHRSGDRRLCALRNSEPADNNGRPAAVVYAPTGLDHCV